MISVALSMIVFAFIGAISPGPVNIIATGAGANFGFMRVLPYVLGTTFSYTIVVFLVGAGLNVLLELYPQITQSLQYIGGAFLLYMSYKIAMLKPVPMTTQALNSQQNKGFLQTPPSFAHGFLAQSLNPKAWLVSMSGVSLFVSANSPASLYLLIFCVISFLCCFIGVGSWAIMGQLISRFLSNEKRQRFFNLIMGLLLSSTVFFIFMAKL